LLAKDTQFKWTSECQDAFEFLKEKLINAPILAFPDMNKPFILTCDASKSAIGYILMGL
jgi:poly(3-hydroxyalkanoate) synthetase